jgi:CRISPR type I-E-associated protein CasB/Cse2
MTDLIPSLQRLQRDRGAMAALRKALIPTQRQFSYRYLSRLGCTFEHDRDVLRFSILAHFWGHHPSHSNTTGNLGRSMRKITGGDEKHPFNKRFERIIACDSLEELAGQLQGNVSLLKRAGVAIDFNQFADDLYWFTRTPDRVKLRWSGGFYVEHPDEAGTDQRETPQEVAL